MNEEFFKTLSLKDLRAHKERLVARNNEMNNMLNYMKTENEKLEEQKYFLSGHQQHLTLILKRQENKQIQMKSRERIFDKIINNGAQIIPKTQEGAKQLYNYLSNSIKPTNDEEYQKKISDRPNVDDIIVKPKGQQENIFNNKPGENVEQPPAQQRPRKKIFGDIKPFHNPLAHIQQLIPFGNKKQPENAPQQQQIQQVQQQPSQQSQQKENDSSNQQKQQQSSQIQQSQQPQQQQHVQKQQKNSTGEEDEAYNIEQDSI